MKYIHIETYHQNNDLDIVSSIYQEEFFLVKLLLLKKFEKFFVQKIYTQIKNRLLNVY